MENSYEVAVNDANFQKEVLESDVPVLVDFWAEWCGPCRMIAPVIGEIAGEYNGKVKVCKMNVEEGQQIASNYGIMNIPTLILFKNGEVVDKIVGIIPKNDIAAKIDAQL
ncbi:MAG: thioredoxin [Candidatus Omnitrophica bacterium]|nr:thioredoxin [Candidatus Omnitrophota bacterium]